MEDNSRDAINLRRCLNNLTMSGLAMILLGIWTAIQAVVRALLSREQVVKFMGFSAGDSGLTQQQADDLAYIVFLLAFSFVFVVIFLIHLYIGLNAVREGRGKARRKKKLYLIIAALIALSKITGHIPVGEAEGVTMEEAPEEETDLGDIDENKAISFVMDLTVALACIDMLYAAGRSRMLKKKIEREAEG